jgi:hypothetical protein
VELSRTAGQELSERRQRLSRTEERIAGLVHFIAEGDHSLYVQQALLELEAQAKMEKPAIEDCVRQNHVAVRLPNPGGDGRTRVACRQYAVTHGSDEANVATALLAVLHAPAAVSVTAHDIAPA